MPYEDDEENGNVALLDDEEEQRRRAVLDQPPPSITDETDKALAPMGRAPQAATAQSIAGPSESTVQPASITAGPLEKMGPAAQREHDLLGQGPPQYHGVKKVLDILGRVTAPGAAIEQRTGLGTLGYQARLGQAAKESADEQTLAKAPLDASYRQAQTEEQQAKAKQEKARAEALLHPPAKLENLQQEYADAVMDSMHRGVNPHEDQKVQQIADAITSLQKEPAGKPDNETVENQRYEKIQQAENMKQPVAPEDKAWAQAYEKRHTLGARTTFNLQNSPGPKLAPDDPNVAWVASGKGKLSDVLTFRTPIGERKAFIQAVLQANPNFKNYDNDVDRKIVEDLTSGGKSNVLLAYNTAIRHMATYEQAAEALKNNNVQVLNAIGNEIGAQFGNDAKTNFEMAKTVFVGEFSRAAEGAGVTLEDRRNLEHRVSASNSPDQFKGVVQYARTLLEGKRDAMKQQFGAGMSGSPDFGDKTKPAETPAGGAKAKSFKDWQEEQKKKKP